MKYLPLFILSALLATACSMKTTLKPIDGVMPTTASTSNVVVFSLLDTFPMDHARKVGSLKVRDRLFTIDCGYELARQHAVQGAKTLGGNALKISKHKKPNILNTCHHIAADVYVISDIWRYEEEIAWSKDRRLDYRDFKGDTTSRPFHALSNCNIHLAFRSKPPNRNGADFTVQAIFDCYDSYFKMTADSSRMLQYQQVHFDLTEIYARMARKELQFKSFSTRRLAKEVEVVFNQYVKDLRTEQEAFNAEIAADPKSLDGWIAKCARLLKQYNEWENPKFEVWTW